MANKKTLFGGRVVKVENRSGFDKSRLNALTTGVGTITPILKQLVIPSSGRISLSLHAELPPLATDAYLRTHLKVEAFFVPLRLLYGGFQSWFSGEEIYNYDTRAFTRAVLPHGFMPVYFHSEDTQSLNFDQRDINNVFGRSSLTDYFNVKFHYDGNGNIDIPSQEFVQTDYENHGFINGMRVNILPYIAYHLCYHHYYRNKSVQRPVFAPYDMTFGQFGRAAAHLPFISASNNLDVVLGSRRVFDDNDGFEVGYYLGTKQAYNLEDTLLDGYCLSDLRQRNYGDDYFTAARPQAQAGSPVQVQTDANGRFTIASLRVQNAMQEFAEVNSYATPDFVQTNMARYGVDLSAGIAQKPIILGSADFPMFTKGVELNNIQDSSIFGAPVQNPFVRDGILGATAGRATSNGQDFVCDFDVKEPGYIMVMATLVPEANYGEGIAHDMRIFINDGDLTELPCALLEHVGDEPIYEHELFVPDDGNLTRVFGYVQRYLWHKSGGTNEVHGLFRPRQSLEAFMPQRVFNGRSQISEAFLKIPTTALDTVAAVASGISEYGVMMDCAINFFVSEPLSESALPSLSNPAIEHGRSVYLTNGGSKLA